MCNTLSSRQKKNYDKNNLLGKGNEKGKEQGDKVEHKTSNEENRPDAYQLLKKKRSLHGW